MKSILLSVLSLACVTGFSQSTIDFSNNASAPISTNSVYGGPATGLTAAIPNSYYYALFAAPPSVTSVFGTVLTDPNWIFTGAYATNTGVGLFRGGMAIIGQPSASFSVIGWSSNVGTTVAAVQSWLLNPAPAGHFGQSVVAANYTIGGPVPLFGNGLGQIHGFTLEIQQVPEPSLLLPAAAAALAFRRRRQSRFKPGALSRPLAQK